MQAGGGYQTKQRQMILNCLMQNAGRHLTVDEVSDCLRTQGSTVGKTTIYRYMEKLTGEGMVRKFALPGVTGTCYQLIPEDGACNRHFHLLCVKCGRLIHLECRYLQEVERHIQEEHRFAVNSSRTVFYGVCDACAEKKGDCE